VLASVALGGAAIAAFRRRRVKNSDCKFFEKLGKYNKNVFLTTLFFFFLERVHK